MKNELPKNGRMLIFNRKTRTVYGGECGGEIWRENWTLGYIFYKKNEVLEFVQLFKGRKDIAIYCAHTRNIYDVSGMKILEVLEGKEVEDHLKF